MRGTSGPALSPLTRAVRGRSVSTSRRSAARPIHSREPRADLAITNARIHVSPDPRRVRRGSVVVRDGRITQVGSRCTIPSGCPIVDAEGGSLVGGFWNAHVHFTEPRWTTAGSRSADSVERDLATMLTSQGFTTVIDLGSDPRTTIPLRDRIESGEVRGPRILTSGPPLYPPRGIPYYVRESIPPADRRRIPQPATPSAATRAVEGSIAWGADVVKLFTGSYAAPGRVLPMPLAVAQAAVRRAHRRGRRVFAHPSNLEGTLVAERSGVDVLAHAPDTTEGIDDRLLQRLARRRVAMVPTLKMFATTVTDSPSYLEPIYAIVRRFRRWGGTLLFGTDVGYMSDYSTREELEALHRCGLNGTDILSALTRAPAEVIGGVGHPGTIATGESGDLVVLEGDPTTDPTAFARVRCTIRAGRVLWSRSGA